MAQQKKNRVGRPRNPRTLAEAVSRAVRHMVPHIPKEDLGDKTTRKYLAEDLTWEIVGDRHLRNLIEKQVLKHLKG
jgi:hypothetical protein